MDGDAVAPATSRKLEWSKSSGPSVSVAEKRVEEPPACVGGRPATVPAAVDLSPTFCPPNCNAENSEGRSVESLFAGWRWPVTK